MNRPKSRKHSTSCGKTRNTSLKKWNAMNPPGRDVLKIYGAPGTGKTTRLLQEIKASGIPLDSVGFVSFTNAAVNEAKRRVSEGKIDEEGFEPALPYFATQHSMNCRLLGIRGPQIADKKLRDFCEKKKVSLTDAMIGDRKETDELLLPAREDTIDYQFYAEMQSERVACLPRDTIPPRFRHSAALYLQFKRKYFEWMEENDFIDFIGMIERGIAQNVLPPVQLLCVDEWQDLSPLQVKQIVFCSDHVPRSVHAGDDDQCIYEWAGARSADFLSFPSTREEVLGQTWRLPKNVLVLASDFIRRNNRRKQKTIDSPP